MGMMVAVSFSMMYIVVEFVLTILSSVVGHSKGSRILIIC